MFLTINRLKRRTYLNYKLSCKILSWKGREVSAGVEGVVVFCARPTDICNKVLERKPLKKQGHLIAPKNRHTFSDKEEEE